MKATAVKIDAPSNERCSKIARTEVFLLGLSLALLWFVLCRQLSGEWSVNEQYNYGWFVPFFALYLFWLRWEVRPERFRISDFGFGNANTSDQAALLLFSTLYFLLFLLLPLRVFEIANPDWRPLGWIHAMIVVALTFFFVWRVGGEAWVRHFAFPIAFILVAVPWVTPIEAPIVQGLMRGVAAIVSEMMNLLGIPAQFEGSVIRVNTGIVGVNEACSGVRSLQTSIMIGLLFGELNRLTTVRRLLLVVATVALALVANVMRTFLLVWLAATHGLPAMERNHDIVGYALLFIVFIGAVASAAGLKRGDAEKQKSETELSTSPPTSTTQPSFLHPTSYFLIVFLWLLFVEIAATGWYRIHEQNLIPRARWTVRWPESAPGFHDVRIDEGVRRTLRFDEGRGVTWNLPNSPRPLNRREKSLGRPGSCLLYFFRWQAGSSSVLRARAHRPDICLPSSGWEVIEDAGAHDYVTAEKFRLPFRHFQFVRRRSTAAEQFAHAFFCVRADWVKEKPASSGADERITGKTGTWNRFDRLRAVLEGERDLGQQVMELVMVSAERISATDAEERFAAMLKEIVVAKQM